MTTLDPAGGLEPDEPDWWQEYKDDLAMGLIDRDGNQLDRDPPDDHA